MTRRVDRVHDLRRETPALPLSERRQAVEESSAASLREVLGLPAGMTLEFSTAGPARFEEARPTSPADVTLAVTVMGRATREAADAAEDATFQPIEPEKRA